MRVGVHDPCLEQLHQGRLDTHGHLHTESAKRFLNDAPGRLLRIDVFTLNSHEIWMSKLDVFVSSRPLSTSTGKAQRL